MAGWWLNTDKVKDYFVKVCKDEELTCYYKYALCDCPEWYAQLWETYGSLTKT